jgi:hypothetical protein
LLDESDDTVIENCIFTQNASIGLSIIAKRAQVLDDTASENGELGVHANLADGLQVRHNLLQHNDTESFAITGAEGNLKITTTNGAIVADNMARTSLGRGMWFDIDSYAITAVRNVVANNADRGMQFEVSGKGIIAGNLIVGNGSDGLSIIDGNSVSVYNNTFWRNMRSVFIIDDDRQRGDTRIPQAVMNVSLRNNVMSSSRPGAKQIVAVEDTTRLRTAASMHVTAQSDAYAQVGSYSAAWWFGWANYPAQYLVFKDLASFTAKTGMERYGLGVQATKEPFFTSASTGNFTLKAGSAVTKMSVVALPGSVAAALGLASGAKPHMGALVTSSLVR